MRLVRTKRLQAVREMMRQAMSRKTTTVTDDDYERALEAMMIMYRLLVACDDGTFSKPGINGWMD